MPDSWVEAQSTFERVAWMGIGTALSLTVTAIVSSSWQYCKEEMVMADGTQSERSAVMSRPAFDIALLVHVKDSMPPPVTSM